MIIILGATGMLGSSFVNYFNNHNIEFTILSKQTCDITNPDHIDALFEKYNARLLINCAAYTAVDDCESNQEIARSINGHSLKHLSIACALNDCTLVHFSTDYVFDGQSNDAYTETDDVNPVSAYGTSKLIGETNIQQHCEQFYIFRIQWLFGSNGHHFINAIHRLSDNNQALRIVNDQFGTPSYSCYLVEIIWKFLNQSPPYGIYHCRPDGGCSWYDYACFLKQHLHFDCPIIPVTSEQFKRPAQRPANGLLNTDKFWTALNNDSLRLQWQDTVLDFLQANYERELN